MGRTLNKSRKSNPRRSGNNLEALRILYQEPIIIPHDAGHDDETPLPDENNPWPMFVLIGGTIVALLCVWFFAPDWLKTTGGKFIQAVFSHNGG